MLNSQERGLAYQKAYLPEHIPDYVEAISGAEPFLHEGHLCYLRTGHMIFVGYPLSVETDKAPEAYESARRFRPLPRSLPKLWVTISERAIEHLGLELPCTLADLAT
jgi:hypothetical protein